jgi:L-amino acid N-acyltransferase YncA
MEIRLAEPADAAGILTIYAPIVRDTATSFELEPPSEEEMGRRIASTLERRPWLVCEADGAVAGYAYAAAHRERAAYQWSVETSVYVHPDHRRRRVAHRLYTALLAALRVQGFANALAGITLPNPASVGFHEACGFHRIGVYHAVGHKLGAWHDVAWLEFRLREDQGGPAGPPCPTSELITRPAWQKALQDGVARLR